MIAQLATVEVSALAHQLLDGLSHRERRVLSMRFGLDEIGEHFLKDVADEFNISTPRAWQIEQRALDKCRLRLELRRRRPWEH